MPASPQAPPPPSGPVSPLPGPAAVVYPPVDARARRLMAWATWLRARVWGFVFAVASDGVTTMHPDGSAVPLFRRNRLPAGPVVVVADHHSHADSAALVATIGRDRRPVLFAAAADYWLARGLRRLAGGTLIGLWPVRRSSAGREDLARAVEAVEAGVVFVVYPEGTRGEGAGVCSFKSGAFEVAQRAGASVLPVALCGTGELLPKGGGYRRGPVEVRWGEVFTPDQVAAQSPSDLARLAQARVESLREAPLEPRPGFGWARAARIAGSFLGLFIVFFWAFGEGISWPLVAEMPLLLLVVTCGLSWRAPLLIATSAFASVLGILTTWWLVTHGFDPPTPLTTPRMAETAMEHVSSNPATAFWYQMFNGIPVKVYANAAGDLGLSFVELLQVVFPRALRICIIGGGAWALSTVLARFLRPCLGAVQVYCLAAFPFALALVVGFWS